MTTPVRRGAAFALVGSLALVVLLVPDEPAVGTLLAAGPFLVVAAVALLARPGQVLFELFAWPADRRDGRLYGLASFALATAGLAVLVVRPGLPKHVFVATVLLLAVGNFAGQFVRWLTDSPVLAVVGFVVGGMLAAGAGQALTVQLTDPDPGTLTWEVGVFLAASGALAAALVRETLFRRDDALVVVAVGLLLWLLTALAGDISEEVIGVALAVTAVLGYTAFALGTASIPGMLTGVLLVFLTTVFGGYGWVGMLVAFFAVGALSTKVGYERKAERGVEQENEGARDTGNVLANSLVALVAVLAAPLASDFRALFLLAFAGAVAAALADTLSSEIGAMYDNPRLITTLEPVEPGTDGAVTWQGTVAGVAGAAIVGVVGLSAGIGPVGVAVVLLAGTVGMTVDSLLGVVLEGSILGNQGVNFFATLAAAIVAASVTAVVGVSV